MGDRMGNDIRPPTTPMRYALRRSFERALPHGRHHRPAEAGACRGALCAVQQHRVPRDRVGGPVQARRSPWPMLRDGRFAHRRRASRSTRRAARCAPTRSRLPRWRASRKTRLQVWGRAGGASGRPARGSAIASGNGGDHQFFGTMVDRGLGGAQGKDNDDGTDEPPGSLEHHLRRTRWARPRATSTRRSATTRRSTGAAMPRPAACWCRRAPSPTRRSSRRRNGSRSGRADGSRPSRSSTRSSTTCRPALCLRLRAARRRGHRASAAISRASI